MSLFRSLYALARTLRAAGVCRPLHRIRRPEVEVLEDRNMPSVTTLPTHPLAAAVKLTSAAVKPASPVFTATAVSASQVNLAWHAVSGASGYLVDEWLNGAWQQIGKFSAGSTTDNVAGLRPGTTYYFDVAAFNAAGTSWANYQGVTTRANVTPPAAPSFRTTAVSSTEIDLSWNAVAGASGYQVKEWINGAWQQIGNFGSGTTSDAVIGLKASTTYYLAVGAYNSAGTTWANYQSATTRAAPPAAPTFSLTPASSSEIDVSWNAVAGATGYLVDEWLNGSWQQIGSFGGSVRSDRVTGLSADTTYYLAVAATNAAGTTWANYQSAATPAASLTVAANPAAGTDYTPAPGGDTLFGSNGPSFLDVHQGVEGDCWLLASLAAVAARVPQDITSMFTYDGTTVESGDTVGVYTVRFFDGNGTARYINVDTELPGGGTYYDQPVNGVLWVALAEKAYAEANGMGYVTTGTLNTNSYDAMDGGDPAWALQAITGKSANGYAINPGSIADAWNSGEPIVLISSSSPASSYIVGDASSTHAYAVVGYEPASSTPFDLLNPWGGSTDSIYCTQDSSKYGYFAVDETFLAQNFTDQSVGAGSALGTSNHDSAAPLLPGPVDTGSALALPASGTPALKLLKASDTSALKVRLLDAYWTDPANFDWLELIAANGSTGGPFE